MAKKRRRKAQVTFIQYSKKLTTAVMIFWALIRIVSVVAVMVEPSSGTTMASIVRGVDDIAMVNCLAYTGNSVSEKIALGYFRMRSKESDEEVDDDDDNSEGNG